MQPRSSSDLPTLSLPCQSFFRQNGKQIFSPEGTRGLFVNRFFSVLKFYLPTIKSSLFGKVFLAKRKLGLFARRNEGWAQVGGGTRLQTLARRLLTASPLSQSAGNPLRSARRARPSRLTPSSLLCKALAGAHSPTARLSHPHGCAPRSCVPLTRIIMRLRDPLSVA